VRVGDQHPTEVLQRSAAAGFVLVIGLLTVRKVQVFFQPEGYIDRRYCEEEVILGLRHRLDDLALGLDETDNKLQPHHPSTSQIGLRLLPLKSQLQPVMATDPGRARPPEV
jgi:hypothetical protein